MKKLLLATALLALTGGAAAAQTVRLGTEGAYPPFNFIDDNGQVAGFEREVGDELCKRAELTCEWVTNDWDSIIPNLQSGNYDVIIAGMSITDERSKVISFSENYFPPAASAYVASDAGADIKGVVSAQVGTIQAGYVAESGATLLEFATPDETIAAVRNGEAAAVFADKDFLKPYVEQSNGELMFVGDDVELGGGVGLGFRQSDNELREKFTAAIQSMKADGTLNAALKKHFGEDTPLF
ncbi:MULTISPECIES: transporter substrate-binding domain-containing protein [Gemmobacter]|jgi:polar amino acid transport system substrate-binding protein|uniref:Amino acid ABC transporter substrate-binding protein (PAAT family) n=2 Tax=Gemmobacter TaxID=204456 RepID=A0A2T6AVW3_9RHOB|nr:MULTISPECIES: transporter substrate-binding domain-containing protein [Gemmobacter]OJY34137.1 MAG: amino acid ABC transporter [Rhodobacterales bacterium 65-51]PTX47954.1 amino acid ABC transporter substrate-binding protein (PAAT family) [Gemmobacter caeni]TWI97324.1 amino acid ABC transporter substrate-binding protein (PAAT family) [Gemmobacter caeni]GHC30567.1 amino acid ABC transporter [Gemmobacter nanjingensis]